MNSREVTTAEEARRLLTLRDLKQVKVAVCDLDGVLRGKYISRSKFESALANGFGFSEVLLGWDTQDRVFGNKARFGWQSGFPDAVIRIVPASCRDLPWEAPNVLFLGEFTGGAARVCPRRLLDRVIKRAENLGFRADVGFEFEFFVFRETPESVRQKHFRNLVSVSPDNFGYSTIRNSVLSEYYHSLMELANRMDFPLESMHPESGPGVIEAAIGVDGALSAADKAVLFKTFSKVHAQRHELMATFMARWSPDCPGQSGHIHMSLRDDRGNPLFHDPSKPLGMSDTMRWFVGGQRILMPELLAMSAPTVNSYRRLVPGYWAPAASSWGIDNRTCALRVILGAPEEQRIEYRVAGADANPYLSLSAALASGMWGIEHKADPEAPCEGNAYDASPQPPLRFPGSLSEAARRLKESPTAVEWFGEEFVEQFVASRLWEEQAFRELTSEWELRRYFEII